MANQIVNLLIEKERTQIWIQEGQKGKKKKSC